MLARWCLDRRPLKRSIAPLKVQARAFCLPPSCEKPQLGCNQRRVPRKRSIETFSTASAGLAGTPSQPEEEASPPGFVRTRWITFLAMFVGYAGFYITRTSLAYVAPFMIEDKALGLDLKAIGGLTSVLPIAYGFSKFLSGVVGANTSASILLAGGLAATGLLNLGFGASSLYILFLLFWGINGLLQGLGAPACARILTVWYPDKLRGTFWGFWTASNNIGGFLSPILVGTAARLYGWRWGMFAPGFVALGLALITLTFMKDSPEAAGYPPVGAAPAPKKTVAAAAPAGEPKKGVFQILTQDVLRNPYVWAFAISYFFVYVVRQGVTSWFVFYLKAKGAANPAVQVSGLELGGLVGSLSSGAVSDYLLRNNAGSKGNVGMRVKVVIAYTVGCAIMLAAFKAAPNVAALQWLLVAGVGFMLYGPQMLVGLCGAETVARPAVSACQGFLGWISYLGAANAGVPLAYVVDKYGWDAYFGVLIACCLVVIVLMLPMLNLKSYSQQQAEVSVKAA